MSHGVCRQRGGQPALCLPLPLVCLLRNEESALELLDRDPSADALEPLPCPTGVDTRGRCWLRDRGGGVDSADGGDDASASSTLRAVGSTGATAMAAPSNTPTLVACKPDPDDGPSCRFLGHYVSRSTLAVCVGPRRRTGKDEALPAEETCPGSR